MAAAPNNEFPEENKDLKREIREAADTIHAIKNNLVDALVVTTKQGNQIFTLQENKTMGDELFNLTAEAVIVCDINGKILRYNRPAIQLATENALSSNNFDHVFTFSNNEKQNIHLSDLINNRGNNNNLFFKGTNGSNYYVDVSVETFKDKKGEDQGFVISLLDITRHVLAEKKAIESLKEKTILLKEIHHRIKNNLQIILSIINLQSDYIQDPAAKEAFNELSGRVRSISLIHEKLYQSESLSSLRIDNYIKDLIGFIKESYDLHGSKITFIIEVEPIYIDHTKALNLGLIMTELITNSVKYAFPQKEGKISISVKGFEDKKVVIIRDDGVGLPENMDIHSTNTLGMQLIISLSGNLEAKMEVLNENGIEYKFTFT